MEFLLPETRGRSGWVVEPREVGVVGVDDVPDGEPGGQDVLSRKAGFEHNTKNTTPKDQLLYQLILKL